MTSMLTLLPQPPAFALRCPLHEEPSMIDRRTFLTAASGLALSARAATAAIQGANNRIRIGVIGTGGRARGLMGLLKKLPGNEMVAVCDVYEPRVLQATEIAGTAVTKVADYRRLLDD